MTKRVSALDLTAGQVEAIEADFGPIDEWSEVKSKAGLLVRILAAQSGESVEALRAMTMRDLMDRVSLGGDDTDPQPPNAP